MKERVEAKLMEILGLMVYHYDGHNAHDDLMTEYTTEIQVLWDIYRVESQHYSLLELYQRSPYKTTNDTEIIEDAFSFIMDNEL